MQQLSSSREKKLAFMAVHLLLLATSLAFVAGRLGCYWWIFDLFSHFNHLYLFIFVIAVGSLFFVPWQQLVAYLLPFSYCAANVLPHLVLSKAPLSEARIVKVATVNLNHSNRRADLLLRFIEQSRPELIVFQEYNDFWAESLSQLKDRYQIWQLPRNDSFGLAVFSKHQFEIRTVYLQGGIPIVVGDSKLGFSFLAVHLFPPINSAYSDLRDKQLWELAAVASASKRPLVLMGDLNNTVWSCSYGFLRKIGLNPVSYTASWPHPLPVIQIDHILTDCRMRTLYRGPYVGSDHYPLVAELVLPEVS